VRIVILTIGNEARLRQLTDAIAEGASAAGAQVRTTHVDASTPAAPEQLLAPATWADAIALGSSLSGCQTVAFLASMEDLWTVFWRRGRITARLGTVFTSLPKASSEAVQAVDALVGLLYRHDVIAIPPGVGAGLALPGFDDRPGVTFAPGGDALDSATVASLKRQGRRLTRRAMAMRADDARLEALQL
jgi:hypothetical protein